MWDWLPAFRAAAEYESLQRAGLALGVSPSALSRSIKLLEDALGLTLFSRSPGGMALTESGARLLAATRDAMRLIHAGLPDLSPNRLRAGAVGPVLPRLLCEATIDALPDWDLEFHDVQPQAVEELLRCGDVDVVLTHEAPSGPGLMITTLPVLDVVLAVGPDGDRGQVACLDQAGYGWPVSRVRASNVEQVVILAQRLGIAVFCPRYAVPTDWTVFGEQPSLTVFLVARESVGLAPAFLAELTRALGHRLEEPTRASLTA